MGVIFNGIGTLYIQNSVFSSNKNTLFCSTNTKGSLYILNSYIFHSGLVLTGYVNTASSNSFTFTPTFKFEHFAHNYCLADSPITIPYQPTFHIPNSIGKRALSIFIVALF